MKVDEIESVKLKIASRLKRVIDDIVDLEEASKPISPENSIGRVSRMDAINNKSVIEASLRSSLETRTKLEMALAKIGTEDFGKCQRCGTEIQFKRLMMMPESDRCIKCAGKL